MFSPMVATISLTWSSTLAAEPGKAVANSLARSPLAFAATVATLRTMSWNLSLRATKSVSEFTSTIAPVLSATVTPTRPSAATRPALVAALERPFLRNQSTACSMSPLVSVRAVLQSIMPAPVLSRSCLTWPAEIAVMRSSLAPRGRRLARAGGRNYSKTYAARSGRLTFDQLLGGGDPTVALDAALEIEQPVEPRQRLLVEIGDLPEVVDANVIEPLLQPGVDVRQPLEIVGFPAGCIDTLK